MGTKLELRTELNVGTNFEVSRTNLEVENKLNVGTKLGGGGMAKDHRES